MVIDYFMYSVPRGTFGSIPFSSILGSQRMAQSLKQMLKLEVGKMPATWAVICGLQSLVPQKLKPFYPKPQRSQLIEGLTPTLQQSTCLLLSVTSRTVPTKVEGFSSETTVMPSWSNGPSKIPEYQQVVTANASGKEPTASIN